MQGRRRRAARDRHGRGLRGMLLPPTVPSARSRAERFDDLVLDAVEHLEERWAGELAEVQFAVEDVPPELPEFDTGVLEDGRVPLARVLPADDRAREPARIVIYRRPLEARSADEEDLSDLVHDVVVEQVAAFLGKDPDEVDPPMD